MLRRDGRRARAAESRRPAPRRREREARPDRAAVFDGAGIGKYFDVVVGSDSTERHKPHPEPLLHALAQLDARHDEAAYVGDSPFDMAAAKAAGVFGVAVAWGGIHRVEDGDVLVESPEELLGVL